MGNTKISFLIPDDVFPKYARYALDCSGEFRPSAICLYRLNDFIESISLDNKESLSAEKLAKIFFHCEESRKEERKPEAALSPLARIAQRSKVEPIKGRE